MNILLDLKDTLLVIFNDLIENPKDHDLQSLLNEIIFYFKNNIESQTSRNIIDGLYDMKKVRNKIAHQKSNFSKYAELSVFIRVHEFIALIIDNKIGNYNNTIIVDFKKRLELTIDKCTSNESPSNIELIENIDDIKNIFPMIENTKLVEKDGNITSKEILSLESYILGYSKTKVNNFRLMHMLSSIKKALSEKDTELLDQYDFEYQLYKSAWKEADIFSVIYAAINNIDITQSEEWKDGVAWSDPYDKGLFDQMFLDLSDIQSLLYSIIRKKIDEDTEINKTKKVITSEMKYAAKKDKLIALREIILKETKIERENCILRKSNIDKILKYGIKTEDDITLYLDEENNNDYKKQLKYIKSIISIMSENT